MSCGVGWSHASDLALLWLCHKPAAVAPIWPQAWEIPYATSEAKKAKRREKNIYEFSGTGSCGGTGLILAWGDDLRIWHFTGKAKGKAVAGAGIWSQAQDLPCAMGVAIKNTWGSGVGARQTFVFRMNVLQPIGIVIKKWPRTIQIETSVDGEQQKSKRRNLLN